MYLATGAFVIVYVNAMSAIMLANTITVPEAEKLIQLGDELFKGRESLQNDARCLLRCLLQQRQHFGRSVS